MKYLKLFEAVKITDEMKQFVIPIISNYSTKIRIIY